MGNIILNRKMKFSLATLACIALLLSGSDALKLNGHQPSNDINIQTQTQTRAKSIIQANSQLFEQLNQKIHAVQMAATAGKSKDTNLEADEMGEVVDKVSERWLGSIDKEEPEIVDDFLYKMKDAISAIHATEGYPKGKILKADEDWLTKIVKNNSRMQEMIPKYDKDERKAIADS